MKLEMFFKWCRSRHRYSKTEIKFLHSLLLILLVLLEAIESYISGIQAHGKNILEASHKLETAFGAIAYISVKGFGSVFVDRETYERTSESKYVPGSTPRIGSFPYKAVKERRRHGDNLSKPPGKKLKKPVIRATFSEACETQNMTAEFGFCDSSFYKSKMTSLGNICTRDPALNLSKRNPLV